MKKRDLMALAVLGISASFLFTGCQEQPGNPNRIFASEHMSPEMQQFYNSLSPEAKQKFTQLNDTYRQAAMDMAKVACGQGTCQTSADNNAAVNIQYHNQTQERGQMMNGMNH